VPDVLTSPKELVGEHKVVAKGVALCTNINKVALSVDGNQADCPRRVIVTGCTQSRTNYTNRQRHQRDHRAQQPEPLLH
jgi:hypothetical protein